MMIVADAKLSLLLSGAGDILEPENNIARSDPDRGSRSRRNGVARNFGLAAVENSEAIHRDRVRDLIYTDSIVTVEAIGE